MRATNKVRRRAEPRFEVSQLVALPSALAGHAKKFDRAIQESGLRTDLEQDEPKKSGFARS